MLPPRPTPTPTRGRTARAAAWGAARPWLPARCLAAGVPALWLATAGCAAVGTRGAAERQAVVAQIVAASVKITLETQGRRVGTGSGIVVGSRAGGNDAEPSSYVLTTAHLLEGREGSHIFVHFAGEYAGRERLAATVVRQGDAEQVDLALLRVAGVAVPPIPFAAADLVRLGEEILIVGFPWGRRLGLFSGIISQLPAADREGGASDGGGERTMIVGAAVSRGVSGGGVFHAATGTLLGVVEGFQTASIAVKGRTQTYSVRVPMPGETYVVPLARLRRFLREAETEGAAGQRGGIGDRRE